MHQFSTDVAAGAGNLGFDVSADGTRVVYGNRTGDVLVYNLSLGKLTARFRDSRSRKPILFAQFDASSTSVMSVSACSLWKWDPAAVVADDDVMPTATYFSNPAFFTAP